MAVSPDAGMPCRDAIRPAKMNRHGYRGVLLRALLAFEHRALSTWSARTPRRLYSRGPRGRLWRGCASLSLLTPKGDARVGDPPFVLRRIYWPLKYGCREAVRSDLA